MPPPQPNCWIYCPSPKSGSSSGFSAPVDGTKIHPDIKSKTWVMPLKPYSFYGFYTLNISPVLYFLWFLSWPPRPGCHGTYIHVSCSQHTPCTHRLPAPLVPSWSSQWLPSMHMMASLNGPLPQPASSFTVLAFLLQSCQLAFSMSFRGLRPRGSCCLDLQLLLDLNSPLRKQRIYIYIFFFQRSSLDFSILDQALPPTIPTPNVVGWILSPQKIRSSLITWKKHPTQEGSPFYNHMLSSMRPQLFNTI